MEELVDDHGFHPCRIGLKCLLEARPADLDHAAPRMGEGKDSGYPAGGGIAAVVEEQEAEVGFARLGLVLEHSSERLSRDRGKVFEDGLAAPIGQVVEGSADRLADRESFTGSPEPDARGSVAVICSATGTP